VPVQLSAEAAQSLDTPKRSYLEDESAFRWDLFSDRMAFEKLYEGIRGFAADGETLKATLRGMLR
jgi:transaldolase